MAFTFSDISIVLAIYFFAAFAKGVSGLGFTTTGLPMLVLIFGLKASIPLLIIPSIVSNLLVMRQAGMFRRTLRQFWPLYISQIPGVILGLWLLIWLPSHFSSSVLGGILILYCSFAVFNPEYSLSHYFKKILALPTGFITGIMNGLTGSQVMPLLPFMLSINLPPRRLIQAINCSFTLSSVLMAFGLIKLELMTSEAVTVSFAGLFPVYLGTKVGGKIRDRVTPTAFRTLVLLVLAIMGFLLVMQSLFYK